MGVVLPEQQGHNSISAAVGGEYCWGRSRKIRRFRAGNCRKYCPFPGLQSKSTQRLAADRRPAYEPGGREFESLRARQ